MWTAPFASGFDVFERLRRHMSVFRRGASAAGPDEQPRTERRTAGATDRQRLRNAFRPNSSKPNPIQTKPDQENGLGLSWIPSSDSGLFNGLRALQNKKTPETPESGRRTIRISRSALFRRAARPAWSDWSWRTAGGEAASAAADIRVT